MDVTDEASVANVVASILDRWTGYSSHSDRRTFATYAARKATQAGGSLRDVQDMLGHASLQTTQRYLEPSSDAKRRLVDLI